MAINDKIMDKPRTPTLIPFITQDIPHPLNNPVGFINCYKAILTHRELSGEDVRLHFDFPGA